MKSDRPPLLVVALGGNALQQPDGDDSVASDWTRTTETASRLVDIAITGPWRLAVTHGNGPQVGNHLLRSELAFEHGGVPLLPLDVCVADTQGGIGYMLQQCLMNAFAAASLGVVVASLVTQVVVDEDDPAFDRPSKPVGEIIPPERVRELESHGWVLAEDARRGGWRRVVPSPDPKEIVEAGAIQSLVEDGIVVVAAGGGGVPVLTSAGGAVSGTSAVVDKDLATALLAADIGADTLMILTDVERVCLNYGTQNVREIESMTVAEARRYLADGQFPPGSMGPKVEALCRFVESTGRQGLIASIDKGADALAGQSGTRVVP